MTHAEIDNLTDDQVAEAVAGVMGWEYHKANGLWVDRDGKLTASYFEPCTDANDDLIAGDHGFEHYGDTYERYLAMVLMGDKEPPHEAFALLGLIGCYKTGDYARALLHAKVEVTDEQDV